LPQLSWWLSASALGCLPEFFLFLYYYYFDLSKIYVDIFFLQICHPAVGSFGGKELPPDEPAVRSLGHGP